MESSYLPLEVIPYGSYCYDENGRCPYWSMHRVVDEFGEGEEGYCALLKESDCILLWDQCKVCGHNEDWEDAGDGRRGADYVSMVSWSILTMLYVFQQRKVYQYGVNGVDKLLVMDYRNED